MNRKTRGEELTQGLTLNLTRLYNDWYESLHNLDIRWNKLHAQYQDIVPKSTRFIAAYTKNSTNFQERRNDFERNISNPPTPYYRRKSFVAYAVENLGEILDSLANLITREELINKKQAEIAAKEKAKKRKVEFASDAEISGDKRTTGNSDDDASFTSSNESLDPGVDKEKAGNKPGSDEDEGYPDVDGKRGSDEMKGNARGLPPDEKKCKAGADNKNAGACSDNGNVLNNMLERLHSLFEST